MVSSLSEQVPQAAPCHENFAYSTGMKCLDVVLDWHDEWILELRSGSISGETIMIYGRSVKQFATWLDKTHPEVQLEAINPKHARDWMVALAELGRAKGTRRVRGIALRRFFAYVAGEADSGLDVNPFAGIELPVADAPLVPVVPDEDLRKLLATCTGTSFVDRRDTALIRMFFDTGCRRAELSGMDVGDLDLGLMEAKVLGKGSRVRLVPISNRTALAVRKYLRARAQYVPADSGPLFVSVRASSSGSWRLTGNGMALMLTRRCKEAGLEHLHLHQLRHTWAHDQLSAGANEGDVERLGGWSPGSPMLRRYTSALADQRARDSARRLARGDRV